MYPLMEASSSKLFAQIHRKNGKQCTDILWLLLFCTLWIASIVIAVFGVMYGNYLPIINGYDSFGNTCGVKDNKPFNNFTLSGTDTSDKTFLLYMGKGSISNVVKICVEECFIQGVMNPNQLLFEHKKTNAQLCRYDFDMDTLETSQFREFNDKLGPCPDLLFYEGSSVKRRCFPISIGENKMSEIYANVTMAGGVLQVFFIHVYQAWPHMCVLEFFALVVSAGVLSLMRWKPSLTVHLICVLTLVSCVTVCVIEWIIFLKMFFSFIKSNEKVLYRELPVFQINKNIIEVLGVLGILLIEGLLIGMLFLKDDLPLVANLCEEAIKCWKLVSGLIAHTVATCMTMLLFFSLWTYTILCIATASVKQIVPLGDRAEYEDDPNIDLRLFEKVEHVEVTWIRNCCWIYIFGFVWTLEFICGCQRFCVEASVAKWYFRRPTTRIAWSLFKNHLGSVARGSILEVFKIPRILLTLICAQFEKDTDGRAVSSVGRGLEAIERRLRMFHGIYAIVGIQQTDLYPAGRLASAIIGNGVDSVDDVDNSVYLIFLSAKLMVAYFTCLLGVFLLHDVNELFFYMAPVLLSALVAFYIAHVLLSTVELTVNTLFLCVCEDKQLHKAGGRWSQGKLIEFCGRNQ